MPKRLTDTEIWNKDWYLDLSIKKKLLLKYLFDNCDCAGVYEISYRNLRNCFNEEITKEDFDGLQLIKFIDENKILIQDFIKLQYGVTPNMLNPENSVHKGILRCLENHKLLPNPLLTLKNKNKDKDKNQNKDKNQDKNKNQNKNMNFDIKNHNDNIVFDMNTDNNNLQIDTNDINSNHENINSDIENDNSKLNSDKSDMNFNHDNMNNSIEINNTESEINNFDIKNNYKKELKSKFNDLKAEMFKEYTARCTHLIQLTGESKSKRTDEKIRLFLNETGCDMEFYRQLCDKADRLKSVGCVNIDFETMLNCRIGIMNGKYKPPKMSEEEKIRERAKRELLETKKMLADYRNFKGDPPTENFKKFGEKLRNMGKTK